MGVQPGQGRVQPGLMQGCSLGQQEEVSVCCWVTARRLQVLTVTVSLLQ